MKYSWFVSDWIPRQRRLSVVLARRIVAVSVCLIACNLNGDEVKHGDVKAVLNTVKEQRSRLSSGEFSGVGTIEIRRPASEGVVLSREFIGAFDNKRGLLRFDTDGEIYTDVRPTSELTEDVAKSIHNKTYKSSPSVCRLVNRFTKNDEYATEWFSIGSPGESKFAASNITLRKPTEKVMRAHSNSYFEVDSAGILFRPALVEMPLTIDGFSEFIDTFFHESEVTQDQSLIRLRLRRDNLVATVTIDTSRGMTATESRMVELDTKGQEKAFPVFRTTARWEEREGVWILNGFESKEVASEGRSRTVSYDVKWTSVNPLSLPDERFRYQDFKGVLAATDVFDFTTGVVKHIDTIGAPFHKAYSEAELEELRIKALPIGRGRVMFVVLNVVAVFAIVELVRRWRRARHTNAERGT